MAEICTSTTKNRWGWGASLLVMSMALGGGAAHAQQAGATADQPASDEAIVVTGFRGSLAASLNVKRDATGFVDAITAEDIADFPDSNLAEAIQRVPGVAIDRDAGEGRSITVRGLGSDFTRVRINGMEALSTTGGTDSSGGANRGRGFDFNVFASELFNSIRVTKSGSASTEEGSLGATVDLRASHPFDFDGFRFATSGQLGYNDLSEETDPRAALLISNTFFDNKFGILVSAAYSKRHLFEEGFSTVRWTNNAATGLETTPPGATLANCGPNVTVGAVRSCWDPTTAPGSPAASTNENVDPRLVANWEDTTDFSTQAGLDVMNNPATFWPRIPRYGRLTHDQDRLGVTAALQWRPTESTDITFDYLFSDFSADREEDFLENFGFSRTTGAGGIGLIDVVSATTLANGSLQTGTFNDIWVRSEARRDHLQTIFQQYVLTATQDFGDRARLTARYGSSLSDHKNPVQTTFFVDAFVSGYTIDFSNDPHLPNINYGTLTNSPTYGAIAGTPANPVAFDPTNASFWQWRTGAGQTPTAEIRLRPQGASNWFRTAQLDFEFDMTDSITLSAGYNWKRFEFDSFEQRRFLPGTQTNNEFQVPSVAQINAIGGIAGITNVLTGFGSGLDLGNTTPTSWLRPDFDKLATAFDVYCNCVNAFGDFRTTALNGANRLVRESDSGGYVQAAFNTELGGMTLRGDVGVRYVKTDIRSFGILGTGGVTATNSYSDTLPAINVVAELTDEFQIRFAANKAMARPPLPQLAPAGGGAVDSVNNSLSVGNPGLDPYRSNNYDLGLEWYFAPESLLSVSVFYKDVESYIQNARRIAPFGDSGLPDSLLNGTGDTAATLYTIVQPTNTPGGTLQGFEITYQQPFTFLPGFFSNFGTILNYTNIDTDFTYITNPTTGATTQGRLVNTSPSSYNATLYYEDDKISARVSAAYRDEYYLGGSLVNIPAQNNNFYIGKEESLAIDASASYTMNDRLSFTFEGINLNDEPNSQFVADQARTRQNVYVYHHTGRQLYFGFRYKY